jgi:hypothetical protein
MKLPVSPVITPAAPDFNRHIWADDNLRSDKRRLLAAVLFARKPAVSRRRSSITTAMIRPVKAWYSKAISLPSWLPAFLIKRPEFVPRPRFQRLFLFPPAFMASYHTCWTTRRPNAQRGIPPHRGSSGRRPRMRFDHGGNPPGTQAGTTAAVSRPGVTLQRVWAKILFSPGKYADDVASRHRSDDDFHSLTRRFLPRSS